MGSRRPLSEWNWYGNRLQVRREWPKKALKQVKKGKGVTSGDNTYISPIRLKMSRMTCTQHG